MRITPGILIVATHVLRVLAHRLPVLLEFAKIFSQILALLAQRLHVCFALGAPLLAQLLHLLGERLGLFLIPGGHGLPPLSFERRHLAAKRLFVLLHLLHGLLRLLPILSERLPILLQFLLALPDLLAVLLHSAGCGLWGCFLDG